MTEKELKKLSRLELLELLLSEIRENDKLRKENEAIRNNTSDSDTASVSLGEITGITERLGNVLSVAEKLTRSLQTASVSRSEPVKEYTADKQSYPKVPSEPTLDSETKKRILSDRDLYWRIMGFYNSNPDAMEALPSDVAADIARRLKGINDAKQQ